MQKITQDDQKLLDELCTSEAILINTAFAANKLLALKYMQLSIEEFKLFLERRHGPFIPSMCLMYRSFILTLIKSIDNKYKEAAIKEIILPSDLNIEDIYPGETAVRVTT